MTYRSFDDKVNIKGLLRLMDSEKVDRNIYLEHKFINEEKLNQYDNAMKDVEEKLRQLDDVIESQQNSINNSMTIDNSFQSESSKPSKKSSKTSKRSTKQSTKRDIKYKDASYHEDTINNIQDDIIAKIQNDMYQAQPQQQLPQPQQQPQNCGLSSQYEKGELMEDVQELIQSLAREGVSTDEIPMIDSQLASVQELREMKYLLMKKWKRKYSRSIVEDIIYVMVKGVESVLDGKTEILGFKPDLKGFGGTVMNSVKSHGLEISRVVEKNCDKYGIGVGDKFMAKVIVSAIKNSAMNKFGNDNHQHQKNMESMYKSWKK